LVLKEIKSKKNEEEKKEIRKEDGITHKKTKKTKKTNNKK